MLPNLPKLSDIALAAFGELDALAVSAQPLTDVLHRTAELARHVVARPVEVSITVVGHDGKATTSAATHDLARELDEVQYAAGRGPCLAAAESGQTILVPDLSTDERWPELRGPALDAGVVSTLAVPLPVDRHVIGALNTYSRSTGAFDSDRVFLAEQFASYAALAIGHTALYLSNAQLATQLQDALASRAVIEQAKGILMASQKCDADRAFDLLVRLSQTQNRKLRDVATDVVAESLRD